jgi:hypothetical protein
MGYTGKLTGIYITRQERRVIEANDNRVFKNSLGRFTSGIDPVRELACNWIFVGDWLALG